MNDIILEMNKENNANVQNITENLLVPNFTLPSQSYASELDKDRESNINCSMSKTSITSVGICYLELLFLVQSILKVHSRLLLSPMR